MNKEDTITAANDKNRYIIMQEQEYTKKITKDWKAMGIKQMLVEISPGIKIAGLTVLTRVQIDLIGGKKAYHFSNYDVDDSNQDPEQPYFRISKRDGEYHIYTRCPAESLKTIKEPLDKLMPEPTMTLWLSFFQSEGIAAENLDTPEMIGVIQGLEPIWNSDFPA